MLDNRNVVFEKKFTWLSLFGGIAFSLSCSWIGISSSLGVGLASGGPLLIIYGLPIVLFFSFMCATSLGQFAYLIPDSCGVSFWTYKLLEQQTENDHTTPISNGNIDVKQSYVETLVSVQKPTWRSRIQVSTSVFVAMLNYFGAMFTAASICSSLAMNCVGMHSLLHKNYEYKRWHLFVCYQCINVTLTFFNLWSGPLPTIGQFGFYISLAAFGLTLVISLVTRSNYTEEPWFSAHYIFGHFENNTGWSSKGMAFIVGLINPMWGFIGIDSVSHMVDEVGHFQSRYLVPKVMKLTVIVGFITSFVYAIGMFFCITNKESVTKAFFPILEIYYQACHNKNLAILPQCFCFTTGYICGIACGTWQSRILWSFGRMFGQSYVPNSLHSNLMKKIGTLTENFKSPLYSHFISQFGVVVIGCIFMWSDIAFNAIITSCITLLMISYAVPSVIFVFFIDREKFVKAIIKRENLSHYKVPSFSIIPHICCIMWAIFCLVFLSFPYTLPVVPSNMNYVSVAYGTVFILIIFIILPIWISPEACSKPCISIDDEIISIMEHENTQY